jgi:hypothetical protein
MRIRPALVAAAATLGLAAPVHADPTGADADFVTALDQAGITYARPDRVIAAGKKACTLMDAGRSGPEIVSSVTKTNPGLAGSGAATFLAIAVSVYCPQHKVSDTGAEDDAPAQPPD